VVIGSRWVDQEHDKLTVIEGILVVAADSLVGCILEVVVGIEADFVVTGDRAIEVDQTLAILAFVVLALTVLVIEVNQAWVDQALVVQVDQEFVVQVIKAVLALVVLAWVDRVTMMGMLEATMVGMLEANRAIANLAFIDQAIVTEQRDLVTGVGTTFAIDPLGATLQEWVVALEAFQMD
jgi:hypothetical protein